MKFYCNNLIIRRIYRIFYFVKKLLFNRRYNDIKIMPRSREYSNTTLYLIIHCIYIYLYNVFNKKKIMKKILDYCFK
jgi:hypothetical protein